MHMTENLKIKKLPNGKYALLNEYSVHLSLEIINNGSDGKEIKFIEVEEFDEIRLLKTSNKVFIMVVYKSYYYLFTPDRMPIGGLIDDKEVLKFNHLTMQPDGSIEFTYRGEVGELHLDDGYIVDNH